MAKVTKQDLLNQIADLTAQLEAERTTILDLEGRIAQYEQAVTAATTVINTVNFAINQRAVQTAEVIKGYEQEVEETVGQRDRAVALATDLSATLVKAVVYGRKG